MSFAPSTRLGSGAAPAGRSPAAICSSLYSWLTTSLNSTSRWKRTAGRQQWSLPQPTGPAPAPAGGTAWRQLLRCLTGKWGNPHTHHSAASSASFLTSVFPHGPSSLPPPGAGWRRDCLSCAAAANGRSLAGDPDGVSRPADETHAAAPNEHLLHRGHAAEGRGKGTTAALWKCRGREQLLHRLGTMAPSCRGRAPSRWRCDRSTRWSATRQRKKPHSAPWKRSKRQKATLLLRLSFSCLLLLPSLPLSHRPPCYLPSSSSFLHSWTAVAHSRQCVELPTGWVPSCSGGMMRKAVAGQRKAVAGQRKTVAGQRKAVAGQRKAECLTCRDLLEHLGLTAALRCQSDEGEEGEEIGGDQMK